VPDGRFKFLLVGLLAKPALAQKKHAARRGNAAKKQEKKLLFFGPSL
jgi:hypothetical protein